MHITVGYINFHQRVFKTLYKNSNSTSAFKVSLWMHCDAMLVHGSHNGSFFSASEGFSIPLLCTTMFNGMHSICNLVMG